MATLGDSDLHSTALLTPRPRSSGQWWGADELSRLAEVAGHPEVFRRIRFNDIRLKMDTLTVRGGMRIRA
jgi:hypothetical protein